MANFVVDRATWRSGRYGPNDLDSSPFGEAKLLNEQGFRCCLGFVCNQSGLSDDDIRNVWMPCGIGTGRGSDVIGFLLGTNGNSELASDAANINDDESLSDEYREQKLKGLFDMHQHTITFTGEYPS